MDENYVDVLQREFAAEEGTFLFSLRGEYRWNKSAFTRLTEAMLQVCQTYSLEDTSLTHMGEAYDKSVVPRWLAEGFWLLATFPRDVSSHPAWATTIAREPDYYAAAYRRLDELAGWFFSGRSGRLNPLSHFTPM